MVSPMVSLVPITDSISISIKKLMPLHDSVKLTTAYLMLLSDTRTEAEKAKNDMASETSKSNEGDFQQ